MPNWAARLAQNRRGNVAQLPNRDTRIVHALSLANHLSFASVNMADIDSFLAEQREHMLIPDEDFDEYLSRRGLTRGNTYAVVLASFTA